MGMIRSPRPILFRSTFDIFLQYTTIMQDAHKIQSRVWEWEGKGAWHFITIEKNQAQEIKKDWHWPRRGFGAIPVKVRINDTEWSTSIFPEKEGTYLLPIKKTVRINEQIKKGDTITIYIQVAV